MKEFLAIKDLLELATKAYSFVEVEGQPYAGRRFWHRRLTDPANPNADDNLVKMLERTRKVILRKYDVAISHTNILALMRYGKFIEIHPDYALPTKFAYHKHFTYKSTEGFKVESMQMDDVLSVGGLPKLLVMMDAMDKVDIAPTGIDLEILCEWLCAIEDDTLSDYSMFALKTERGTELYRLKHLKDIYPGIDFSHLYRAAISANGIESIKGEVVAVGQEAKIGDNLMLRIA